MRKKIFSALLLSMLAFASTSTLVSCKDYDDDISANTTAINDLKGKLSDLQSSLTSQLSALQGQLTSAKTELQNAIDKKADKTTVEALTTRVQTLEGQVSVIENKIKSIDETLKTKADQSDLDAKYSAVTGEIEKTNTNVATLKKAVEDNLEIQKAVNVDVEKRLKALEDMLSDYPEVKAQVAANKEAIAGLTSRVEEAEGDINDLYRKVNAITDVLLPNAWDFYDGKISELNDKINEVDANVNALELFVKKTLSGLVFMPDCYYWGIEAANLELETAYEYNDVPAASYDVAETKGVNDDERYDSTLFKVDYGFAVYHKNPSTAEIDKSRLSLISFERDYVLTRANKNTSDAGLSIVNDSVVDKGGLLIVPLQVANVDKVGSVLNLTSPDKPGNVTVFALQYSFDAAGDSTITSDYAALLAKEDTVTYKIGLSSDAKTVSAISGCTYTSGQDEFGHAMQTVHEAAGKEASYDLAFGDTIDLNDYVMTHRVLDGEETALTPAEFLARGYKYEFALTKHVVADVNQSEHAALDGSKLTTKKCDYDAILNGYTPVVRVVLKDKAGRILDYAYIKFQITGDLCDQIGDVKYEVDDAVKVQSYWYAINGAENSGKFEEIHYNVATPEEAGFYALQNPLKWKNANRTIALALANNKFINVFTSENVFDPTQVEIKDKDQDVDMIEAGYIKAEDFIFTLSEKNNDQKFKGDTGAEYVLKINETGDSLFANKVGAETEGADTLVATLKKDVTMSEQKLVLNRESEYAKDMLNYQGRTELSNDFLTVQVALGLTVKKAVKGLQGTTWEDCKTVETTNVWPARFIRPINLASKNPEPIQDAKRGEEAAEYQGQPAYLHDILSFTDWQGVAVEHVSDTTNCLYQYYGIQNVEIIDAEGNALVDGDNIITVADNVLSNIANPTSETGSVMKDVLVGQAVTLTFKEATSDTPAHIWYKNNGNTVSEKWWFEIPVRVQYWWGSFVRRVKVYVEPTY